MSVDELFSPKFRRLDILRQWYERGRLDPDGSANPEVHERVGALLQRPYSEVSESECIELRKAISTQQSPDDKTIAILYHGGQSYSMEGKDPINVSPTEHSVLQAFLVSNRALVTKELEQWAANPSKTMAMLAKKFPGAIRIPGKDQKGNGYFARVKPR